jgi:hypothetical protein
MYVKHLIIKYLNIFVLPNSEFKKHLLTRHIVITCETPVLSAHKLDFNLPHITLAHITIGDIE